MKADIAIQRLITRFSGGHAITPNDADRAALKSIVSNYNEQQAEINYSQEPFAKLYIFLYHQLLMIRNIEIADLKAAKILTDVLELPKFAALMNLHEEINHIRMDKVIQDKTAQDKINYFELSDMTDEDYEIYKKELVTPDVTKIFEAQVSYEDVCSIIGNKVNQLLEDYK
tara:strand:- start:76 stop:588 length:513 start_codon:yes stop_codon:yes gene_type:complete